MATKKVTKTMKATKITAKVEAATENEVMTRTRAAAAVVVAEEAVVAGHYGSAISIA